MATEHSVGRILTAAEACEFYTQVEAAEKAMGPLTREEKLIILSKFGANVTSDDLVELLQGKRALVIKNPLQSE